MRIFAILSLCLLLTACDQGPGTAVVDVNQVLLSSPHAKQAETEATQAQQIYQYNLNAIEKKLATYKNRPQAEAWVLEAGRQLQTQLTNSRTAISQAMGETLRKEITAMMGTEYNLVLAKSNVLASQDTLDITAGVQQRYNSAKVAWPPRPKRIDNPSLPADTVAAIPKTTAP